MTIAAALPSNLDCSKDVVLTFIVPAQNCYSPPDYARFIREVSESSRIVSVFIRPDKGFISPKNKYLREIVEQCERSRITYQVSPLAFDIIHELSFVRRCHFLRPRSYVLDSNGHLAVGIGLGAGSRSSFEIWLSDSMHAQELISELDAKDDGSRQPPPLWAEAIMRCTLPRRDRKRQLGDLSEEFGDVWHKHGPVVAHIFYYSQLAASLVSWVPRSFLGK